MIVSPKRATVIARVLMNHAGDNEDYNKGIIDMLRGLFDVTEKEAKDMVGYAIVPRRIQVTRRARFVESITKRRNFLT